MTESSKGGGLNMCNDLDCIRTIAALGDKRDDRPSPALNQISTNLEV